MNFLHWLWNWLFPDSPLMLAGPGFAVLPFVIGLAIQGTAFVVQGLLSSMRRITRGQQQGEVFIQNAEEGDPLKEFYGAAPEIAIEATVWAELTNVTVQADNAIKKTGGADYENDAGATVATVIPSNEDFTVAWSLETDPEGRTYCGLMPTSSTVLETDACPFGILVSSTPHLAGGAHSIFVFELGVQKHLSDRLYTPGDTLAIVREAGQVKYFHKGTLLYTSTATTGAALKFSALIATSDTTVDNVAVAVSNLDVAGGMKAAGTVVWAVQPRKVTTTTSSGGGGKGTLGRPRVDNITYYTDLFLAVGRGRLRLKKVFFNADLVINLDSSVTGIADNGSGGGTYSVPNPNEFPGRTLLGRILRERWGSLTAELRGDTILRWYNGSFEQLTDTTYQADVGNDDAPAYRGRAMLLIQNLNISKYGGVPTVLIVAENEDLVTLADLANDLCERVGLEPQDRDFSALAEQRVRGLLIGQPQSPRQTLEYAAAPYNVAYHETVDGQLVGVLLGTEPVVTIPPEHWGFMEGDQTTLSNGQSTRKLEFTLDDPTQLPRQVTVTAYNPLKNHETTSQHAYRMTGPSEGVETINLPMALIPDEARVAAERLLYRRHVEREQAAVTLPWLYGWLAPNDVVEVTSANLTHRLRLDQIAGAVPGPLDVAAVADEVLLLEPVPEPEPQPVVCTPQELHWDFDRNVGCAFGGFGPSSIVATFDGDRPNGYPVCRIVSVQRITQIGEHFDFNITVPTAESWMGVTEQRDDSGSLETSPARLAFEKPEFHWHIRHGANLADVVGPDGVVLADVALTGGLMIRRESGTRLGFYRYSGATPVLLATVDADHALGPLYACFVAGKNGDGAGPPSWYYNAVCLGPTVTTGTGGGGGGIDPELREAFVLFGDTRQLRAADTQPGVYAAVVTRNASFAGAGLYRDAGAGYTLQANFTTAATAGTLAEDVGSGPLDDWDDATTLVVDLYGTTAALYSSTDAEVEAGANAALLGTGEVIGFVNATRLPSYPNRWEVTRLLRGRRCTNFDLTHTAGEQFVLLDDALRFVPLSITELNVARNWKAVAVNQSITAAPSTSFTWTGRIIEVAAPTAYALTLDTTRREVNHTWLASADICTLTPGLIYEIYLDNGAGQPGALLWTGNALTWREAVNTEGTRIYHLRARTDYATSSYITATIVVDYTTPGFNNSDWIIPAQVFDAPRASDSVSGWDELGTQVFE